MIPEKLKKFDVQALTLFVSVTKLITMMKSGMVPENDPRIDIIIENIDSLNGRLDRLSSVMGSLLSIQLDEYHARTKRG